MCHVLGVRCQVSRVRCHVSGVTYYTKKKYYILFFIFIFFCQSGGASWLTVCYQRGLPRLVFQTFINFLFGECNFGHLQFDLGEDTFSTGGPWGGQLDIDPAPPSAGPGPPSIELKPGSSLNWT